jgi:hypothetical protein
VSLPGKTKQLIERAARESGLTASEYVRVVGHGRRNEQSAGRGTPPDRVAGLDRFDYIDESDMIML